MADLPQRPNHEGDAGLTEDRPPAMPRWVKISGIAITVLVLLVVIMMLASGGTHGPGRHLPSSRTGDHIPLVAQEVHLPQSSRLA
jgi:hypothetical protein